MDFLYDEGPQGVTPYSGSSATQASGMVSDLLQESSADAGYGDLASELTGTEGLVGLIPATPPPIPAVAAGLGAFSLGWAIGTGINKLFLHIGLSDGSAPSGTFSEFCYSAACNGALHWYAYGSEIYNGDSVQQIPGAYLYWGIEGGQLFAQVRWFEPPCTFTGFTAPPGSRLQTGVLSASHCGYAPMYVDYPYVTIADVERLDMLHRYNASVDGSPGYTSPAPADPGITTAEQRAQAALDGENPTLRAWLERELDPDRVAKEDPMLSPVPGPPGQGYDENDPCNPGNAGVPRYVPRRQPGYQGEDPRAAVEQNFYDVFDPLTQQLETVPLLYGETAGYNGAEGWGYRHIAYEHGWGAGDALDTDLALTSPTRIDPQTATSFRYERDYTGSGGVSCTRRVVVEYNDDPADGLDGPKYILTSFHFAD